MCPFISVQCYNSTSDPCNKVGAWGRVKVTSWLKCSHSAHTDILTNHHISPCFVSSACYPHLQIHTYTHTNIHTCTHTHIHTHAHTHAHTHTHIHTHKPHMLVITSTRWSYLSLLVSHCLQYMPMFHSLHYLLVSHNLCYMVLAHSICYKFISHSLHYMPLWFCLIASTRCLCLIASITCSCPMPFLHYKFRVW